MIFLKFKLMMIGKFLPAQHEILCHITQVLLTSLMAHNQIHRYWPALQVPKKLELHKHSTFMVLHMI